MPPKTQTPGAHVRTSAKTVAASPAPPGEPGLEIPGTLPLGVLRASPTNPRKTFPDASVAELAASFAVHGVLQPLLVRPMGAGGTWDGAAWHDVEFFEVVAGERRLRAATLNDTPKVPVVVRFLTDAEVLEIQLIENDQREDVRPSEQAAAYGRLAATGKTVEQIAAVTGKTAGFVRSVLALARLPAWALAAVDAGVLPRRTAEIIARIPGEKARANCTAAVLAGRAFIGDDTVKPPQDPADCEPLTYRGTEQLIARSFQVELKKAAFSRKALDLVSGEGSCEECPKRAGNDPDARAAGTRADMCLDPVCFQAKTDAHHKQELAVARSTGLKVLPAKESEKLFPYSDSLSYSSGYVDLEETCYEAKGKKYKTLLEKHVEPAQVVVAVDRKGTPHKLVKKEVAAKILREQHKIGAKGSTGGVNDSYKREERKRREKAELGRLAQIAACERVVEVMGKAFAPLDAYAFAGAVTLLRQVAAEVSDFAGADVCRVIVKRRGLEKAKFDDRGTVANLAAGMSDPRELIALIAECAAARVSWGWGAAYNSGKMDNDEVAFWKAFGVDRAKLLLEARAEKEEKAKQKGKKPTKPPIAPNSLAESDLDAIGGLGLRVPKPAAKKAGKNGKSIHKPGCTFEAQLQQAAKPVGSLSLAAIPGFPPSAYVTLHQSGVETLADLEPHVEKFKTKDSPVFDALRSLGLKDSPHLFAAGDAIVDHLNPAASVRTCRVCGCTDENCSKCVERTGMPCHWIEADLCSACEKPIVKQPKVKS